jgi:redox-sensitive bicupin YhaK (pirin superfamily)
MLDSVIDARNADLGNGLRVRRVLPFSKRRMVGPFIFFDHAGPVTMAPDAARKADVRPHPHIGLATVSYLFSGAVTHRDSLGVEQVIRPGDVNWMTAGRGIAHSERFEDPAAFGGAGREWNCCSRGWRCPKPMRKPTRLSTTIPCSRFPKRTPTACGCA